MRPARRGAAASENTVRQQKSYTKLDQEEMMHHGKKSSIIVVVEPRLATRWRHQAGERDFKTSPTQSQQTVISSQGRFIFTTKPPD